MNWLAHLFLSEKNIDHQLGNLLADYCKGRAWDGASPGFVQGLAMHKRIDAFTDRHPAVLLSKSRLGAKGHLKGVIIDLTYDLFLTAHWNHYSTIAFDQFIETFYAEATAVVAAYPQQPRAFVINLIQADYLRSYGDLNGLAEVFSRIDRRLSHNILKRESVTGYLPLVACELENIEQDFLDFFPDLLTHVRAGSNDYRLGHWQSQQRMSQLP